VGIHHRQKKKKKHHRDQAKPPWREDPVQKLLIEREREYLLFRTNRKRKGTSDSTAIRARGEEKESPNFVLSCRRKKK